MENWLLEKMISNESSNHTRSIQVSLQSSCSPLKRGRETAIYLHMKAISLWQALWTKHIKIRLNTFQLCKCMHKPLPHETLILAIGHSLIPRGIPGLQLSRERCWYGFDCVPQSCSPLSWNINTQQIREFTSAQRCVAMNTKPVQCGWLFFLMSGKGHGSKPSNKKGKVIKY